MKKCYFIAFAVMFFQTYFSQVGINTTTPKSTLQVQKRSELTFPDGVIPPRISGDSLRLKEAAYGPAQNGALVYVTSPATTTGPKTQSVTTQGLFVYDATAANSSGQGLWNPIPGTDGEAGTGAYSARFSSNFGLLGVTVGGGIVNLNIGGSTGGITTEDVPSPNMSNGIYTVPSTGLYHITYNYKEGSGANVNLLTDSGIQIIRTPVATTTTPNPTPVILAQKRFGGVSVALVLTVSITQTTISHIYRLNKGDRIQFAINRQSVLNLSLATEAEAEISIYKIR